MLLEVQNLKKNYGNRTVVNIPSLGINQGEAVGLVGNNGAGKTTLFRMILDLIRPTEGKVLSNGEDVSQSDQWKKYTGSFIDEGFVIDYLTPEEYFDFIGQINHLSRAAIQEQLNKFSEVFNDEILKKGKYIRDLSKGNKNKVGIAAALLANPQLLILDEPFANLDPTTQIRLKKLIREYKAHDVTMFISSHDLNHVTEVCDRIVILEKGVIVKDLITSQDTLKELESYFAA
ncbi:MAG: ABC transporter ATP-binding protein [Chitinophagaceae bacterium]|nr:ABC transporter ATP-binding protein [Chitinophagaceae bacterium]MCZ2397183.1 ABC transporter ATP-binding protein [Chitinophagales bacterium]